MRIQRKLTMLATASAALLLTAPSATASRSMDGGPYELSAPAFDIDAAPDGSILVADGDSLTTIRHGSVETINSVPLTDPASGINGVAAIGAKNAWVATGGADEAIVAGIWRPDVGEIIAGSDADDARLWPVADALDGDLQLAFDHSQILRDAVERAADDLDDTDLATAFVGPTFTLSELQNVYEAIWGDEFDAANFRRSLTPPTSNPANAGIAAAMAAAPPNSFVEPTGERSPAGPKGGRPPELYRAGKAWTTGSPIKRSRRNRRRLR